MLELLKEYLKINTAHPKPNYDATIDFFTNIAIEDGFKVQKVILSSSYPVLIITYEGTDPNLPSLGLNHHMDTVAVTNETEWRFPPFSATVYENRIYGRGTQDMKGIGIIHYAALRELKKDNIKLNRTVHMIIVPEEELGGIKGTKQFINTPEFKNLNLGFVIDEGKPSGNNNFLFIKVSERKPIQIKLTSKGELAHSSKLMSFNSAHELVKLLNTFVDFQKNQQLINCEPGNLLSIHITSLSINNNSKLTTYNVIPSEATATMDIRVPPSMFIKEAHLFIQYYIKDFSTISYDVIAESTEEFTLDYQSSMLYKILKETVEQEQLQAKPLFFEASTDLRFYLAKGIEGVGFTPFLSPDNLHETNESISIQDLVLGQKIFYSFLQKFCILKEN